MAYESNLQKGAYGNPQRQVDKATQDLLKQNTIASNLLTTFKDWGNMVAKQKKYNDQLQAAEDKQEQTLYAAMNTAGSTGFAHIDQSVVNLWNGKVDDFFRIKNAMHEGVITRREGNRELSKIMAMPKKWASTVQVLAKNKKLYDEAKKNGTLSSLGSVENKSILDGNKWDVSEQGGNFFFYQDAQTVDGLEMEKSVVNGDMLLAADAAGKDMFEEKVDISELETNAYNTSFNPTDIKSEYFTIKEYRNGDIIPGDNPDKNVFTNIPEDQAYTYKIMTKDQSDQARADLASNGSLTAILNNESIMPSYWQDSIPDGGEGQDSDPNSLSAFYDQHEKEFSDKNITKEDWVNSSWNNFGSDLDEDTVNFLKEKQKAAAMNFMVEETMNKNADVDQTLKMVSKRTIKDEEATNSSTDANNMGTDGFAALETVKYVHNVFEDLPTNMSTLKGRRFNGKIISDVKLEDGELKLYAETRKEDLAYADEDGKPLIEHEKEELWSFDPNSIEQRELLAQYLYRANSGQSESARNAYNLIPTTYLKYNREKELEKNQIKLNKNIKTKVDKDLARQSQMMMDYRKTNRLNDKYRKQYYTSLRDNPQYMEIYKELKDIYGTNFINEARKDDPELYKELQSIIHETYKNTFIQQQESLLKPNEAQAKELDNLN